MIYNIETRSRENVGKIQKSSDPSHCRITEYASNDWTYNFRGWWSAQWERPLLRVTRANGIVRVIVVEHKGPFHCDIYFNGVKILEAVGGLERRHIGSMLGYEVESGQPAPVQELATKSYMSSGDRYLTYYGVKGSSFGVVSEHHMEELPKAGWNVHFILMSDFLTRGAGTRDQVGIIHPVFYVFQNNYSHIGRLRTFHQRICGFDLADTDALHHSAVNMANRMDLLMVPSEHSRQIYVNSGVKTRVEVVPHGVGPLFSSLDTKPLHMVPKDGIKVLYFFLHSESRKGYDIVQSVMDRLFRERQDIRLIVKGGGDPVVKSSRTTLISDWLWEGDLVHLYDACDVLFLPSRGGGCELNGLEAMTRGVPIVASEWPAIKEYAEGATFIKTRGKVKPLADNPIHIGYGVDPDPEDAYVKLKYAIENVWTLKREAMARAPAIRARWSWANSARKIAQCLESL